MSTSDDWPRIRRLFEQAADLPDDARAAFLDREAGIGSELRSRVDELLDADHETTGFLDSPASGDALGAEGPWEGQTFGSYRVERELGRGGTGVVFLARRADGRYEREVALKVVPAALLQRNLAERFRSEVRILAELDHPNIAGLLDAGETEEGLAYLVMEYVDGASIDRYADDSRLDLRSRLRLFRRVLDGVHFAHRRGVVHRDLKPSNILVTREGDPKLVDFGIAKLVADSSGSAPTRTMQRMLTPDYASPEQVSGDAVDARSDVYSLGVVLYRLLTGRPPYALTTTELAHSARVICEEVPVRPSDALNRRAQGSSQGADSETLAGLRSSTEERVRRTLKGDLDTIVLHALAKEPAARYPTAGAFGEDIDRYLDGRPIRARKPGVLYRARRFVRRRGVALTAASIMAAGVIISAWQAREAALQRRMVATNSAELTTLVRSVLTTLNTDMAGEDQGPTATRAVAVETAVAALDTLASRAERGPSTDLLEALATAYREAGTVQGHPTSANVGRPEDAKESFERAIEYWRQLGESDPLEVSSRVELAVTHVLLSDLHRSRGQNDAAAVELDQAEAIMDSLRVRHQPDRATLGALAMVYEGQAKLAEIRGDLESTATYVEQMSDVARGSAALSPEGSARLGALEEVVLALQSESYVRSRTGAVERAIDVQWEAVRLADSIAELPGSTQRMASIRSVAWSQLGWRYNDADRPDEAVEAFDRAVGFQRQLRDADPGNQAAQGALGQLLAGRGQAHVRAERWEEALADHRQAIELVSSLAEAVPAAQYIIAQSWRQVGEAQSHLGRFVEAHEAHERSLSGTRELLNADPTAAFPKKLQAFALYSQGVYYRLRALQTGDAAWCTPAGEAMAMGVELWDGLRAQGQVFPGEQRIWEDFLTPPPDVCRADSPIHEAPSSP